MLGQATLQLLRTLYPAFGKAQPLAVGVQQQLLEKHADLPEQQVKEALRKHCGALAYQKALARAESLRIDLDGTVVEPVSESQRELAKKRVAGIREKKLPKPPPPPPAPPKVKGKAKFKPRAPLVRSGAPRSMAGPSSPPVQPTVLLKVSRKLQMVGLPAEPEAPPARPVVNKLVLKRP